MTLSVGIVGCGGIAQTKHVPSLLGLKDREVEITDLCDIHVEKAHKFKEQFGLDNVRIWKNYKEMCENGKFEVVHICTPNVYHSEMSVYFLQHNKHVFCEKPMAITTAEAVAMINAELKSGMKLTIGYQNRYKYDSILLKNICDSGTLGKIYHAKAKAIRRRAIPTWGVFLDKDIQGGGALIDIGSHALDLTLWLMDNYQPEYVIGKTYNYLGKSDNSPTNLWGPWRKEDFTVEDSCFGTVLMKNGSTINIDASWALNVSSNAIGESKTELFGIKAGANNINGVTVNGELFGALYENEVEPDLSKIEVYDVEKKDPGVLEIEDWIERLFLNKGGNTNSINAGVVTSIIEALYLSSEKSREEKVIDIFKYIN